MNKNQRYRFVTLACAAVACLAMVATLPTSVLARPQNGDSPATQANGQGELPRAEEVIARSIKAAGGEEALRALKQMHGKGTLELPMVGIRADMELFVDDSGEQPLMKGVIELPQMGTIIRGLTPNGGYEVTPMQGSRKLTEAEVAAMREEADFQSNLDLEKYYESWKTIGRQEVDGTPAVVVELIDKQGKSTKIFYAEEGASAGLPIATQTVQSSPMGDIPSRTKLSDYRDVEGPGGPVKMSFKTEGDAGGQKMVTTMNEIDLQPDLTENDVAPPEEVKEMLEN